MLQLLELLVEVLLKFKHDLAHHLNLETLTLVSIEFKRVVEEIVDV